MCGCNTLKPSCKKQLSNQMHPSGFDDEHRYQFQCNTQQCAWLFYLFVEPEVIVLVLAGVITQMTQITSPSELHNRIWECQGSHSLPAFPIGCGVVVLMSEAERLPWRWAPRWHFKRTAHGRMKQSISDVWESGRSRSRDQDKESPEEERNYKEM